ncbi:WD40 repeat domain-containing protein [Streptomyces nogalater]
MCVLALLAVTGGALAWMSSRREAEQRRTAVSQLVAAEAETLQRTRPGLAKQLSMVANRLNPDGGAAPMIAAMELPGVLQAGIPAGDISLDADGTRLAISTGTGVTLWDVTQGRGRLGDLGRMNTGAVALSPDGRLLAAVRAGTTASGSVGLWDVSDPGRPRPVTVPGPQKARTLSLAVSGDGRMLALGRVDGRIELWDISDRAAPARRGLWQVTRAVSTRWPSPSGRLLASAGSDGTVRLWDPPAGAAPRRGRPCPASGSKTARGTRTRGTGRCTGWRSARTDGCWRGRETERPPRSGCGGCRTGTACGRRSGDGRMGDRLPGQSGFLAFDPDGKSLVGACDTATVLWDVRSPSKPRKTGELPGAEDAAGMPGPAVFTPHGRKVLRASKWGVLLWYVENPQQPTAAASFGQTPAGFQTTTRFSGGVRRLLVIHGANGGALWDLSASATLHKSLARLPGSEDIGAEEPPSVRTGRSSRSAKRTAPNTSSACGTPLGPVLRPAPPSPASPTASRTSPSARTDACWPSPTTTTTPPRWAGRPGPGLRRHRRLAPPADRVPGSEGLSRLRAQGPSPGRQRGRPPALLGHDGRTPSGVPADALAHPGRDGVPVGLPPRRQTARRHRHPGHDPPVAGRERPDPGRRGPGRDAHGRLGNRDHLQP